jgi:hypothetical protein
MSLLPQEVHTALSQLLRALSTPDNAVRSQAEEQLNNDWVQSKPDILLMGLAEQIAGAEDTLVSATHSLPREEGETVLCVWVNARCTRLIPHDQIPAADESWSMR